MDMKGNIKISPTVTRGDMQPYVVATTVSRQTGQVTSICKSKRYLARQQGIHIHA